MKKKEYDTKRAGLRTEPNQSLANPTKLHSTDKKEDSCVSVPSSTLRFFAEKIEPKGLHRPELWQRHKIVSETIFYFARDTRLN